MAQPIQTYRDPKTGKIFTADGKHIVSLEDYKRRVASGEISGKPLDISALNSPSASVGSQTSSYSANIPTGNYSSASPASPASPIGSSGITNSSDEPTLTQRKIAAFKNNTSFLEKVKEIMQKKQNATSPLSAQKEYWRSLQRDTSPFGGTRDASYQQAGQFTDARLRQLSPSEQASVRASRDAAVSAHLQGIKDEETYRNGLISDTIAQMRAGLEEQRQAEQDAIAAEKAYQDDKWKREQAAQSQNNWERTFTQTQEEEKRRQLEADRTYQRQITKDKEDAFNNKVANEIAQNTTLANMGAAPGTYEFTPEGNLERTYADVNLMDISNSIIRSVSSVSKDKLQELSDKLRKEYGSAYMNDVRRMSAATATRADATDKQIINYAIERKIKSGENVRNIIASLAPGLEDNVTTILNLASPVSGVPESAADISKTKRTAMQELSVKLGMPMTEKEIQSLSGTEFYNTKSKLVEEAVRMSTSVATAAYKNGKDGEVVYDTISAKFPELTPSQVSSILTAAGYELGAFQKRYMAANSYSGN